MKDRRRAPKANPSTQQLQANPFTKQPALQVVFGLWTVSGNGVPGRCAAHRPTSSCSAPKTLRKRMSTPSSSLILLSATSGKAANRHLWGVYCESRTKSRGVTAPFGITKQRKLLERPENDETLEEISFRQRSRPRTSLTKTKATTTGRPQRPTTSFCQEGPPHQSRIKSKNRCPSTQTGSDRKTGWLLQAFSLGQPSQVQHRFAILTLGKTPRTNQRTDKATVPASWTYILASGVLGILGGVDPNQTIRKSRNLDTKPGRW